MRSLTGSTIICCRSLFKLAVWCCPLPQPPRIIHCWCLNLPFQCWLSFNSYPRLCVSICYIVKLSIDILWFSFHGRAINQYNSIFTVPQSQGDPKIVKRGPKGDPILSKKGTFLTLKGTQNSNFSELFTKSEYVKIVKKSHFEYVKWSTNDTGSYSFAFFNLK